MSLLYQYVPLVFDDAKSLREKSSTPRKWYEKVNMFLPRQKKDELKTCQRRNGDIFYSVSDVLLT